MCTSSWCALFCKGQRFPFCSRCSNCRFRLLMAAEFFENSSAPGSFCWIIVAVCTLWIVTLFKHAELLWSSSYRRVWNGSKWQSHFQRGVYSNWCVQEDWGLGAPALSLCVPALTLCPSCSRLSWNWPVNHRKTRRSMLWFVNYVQHFSTFSWQVGFPMYNHNNDNY